MQRWQKRLVRALAVAGAVVATLGGAFWAVFGGLAPIADRAALPGGAVVVQDGYVAGFLVPLDGGKYAVVDAGLDTSGKALLAALSERGATPADVVALLITHGHPDHTVTCGGLPNAIVHAGAPELAVLDGTVETLGIHVTPPIRRVRTRRGG